VCVFRSRYEIVFGPSLGGDCPLPPWIRRCERISVIHCYLTLADRVTRLQSTVVYTRQSFALFSHSHHSINVAQSVAASITRAAECRESTDTTPNVLAPRPTELKQYNKGFKSISCDNCVKSTLWRPMFLCLKREWNVESMV